VANMHHHTLSRPLDNVSWSPSGDRLAIVQADRGLLIWNVAQSQIIGQLSGDDACCRLAAWSGDSRRIITYGFKNIVRVWDSQTLTMLKELNSVSQIVLAAELSPDGRLAVVGDGDEIYLWDLDADTKECLPLDHEAVVTHLCFDCAGQSLFS